MNNQHTKAQEISAHAASLLSAGQSEKARQLFAEAADLEAKAIDLVPPDKVRTRSILSISHASLLYKAGKLKEAERCIFAYLSAGKLADWGEAQIRELLNVVTDEYLLVSATGRRYSGESITMALRGGDIGAGTGPLDLVLEKAAGFRSLLYRTAEWVGQFPLRRHGPPAKELLDLVQARVTEPAIGSYTLEIKLTEPVQPHLYEPLKVPPSEVSDGLFAFLDCLTSGAPEELDHIIPQPGYRKALLQLTRNIVPGGKRIREISIYRKKHDRLQSICLTDALPPRIREAIPKEEVPAEERWTDRGILRALHLDNDWLVLAKDDGTHVRASTVPELLDDVVGPMVNRRVIVTGTQSQLGLEKRFLVSEIELADEG